MNAKMKWIAALKIWIVIYPSATLFLYLFGKAIINLPLYQRTFFLTITLVPWMMFAGLPLLDSALKKISKNQNINKNNGNS